MKDDIHSRMVNSELSKGVGESVGSILEPEERLSVSVLGTLTELQEQLKSSHQWDSLPVGIKAKTEMSIARLSAGAPIPSTTKPETLAELDRLIRKEFDQSHWTETSRWTDLAKDLGREEVYQNMKEEEPFDQ